ncbi:hypothetical protein GCM10017576_09460 [Microbacterium barkeri]|uniref:Methyltransferase domain-containing protein n=1 Tax=Microbacterium barkeri TaxID=33917 RepID=A0A9W6H211_9MICO|nr:class I SAM-dependent methyltransferase [Microbacterium barkeri]MDR6877662.1 SAM-dependent methyltransferase [Microbacterium barkeri]GLJ60817.1 hypothetical protein GCM10017576_09460 [Microbacterium barkeri]
MDQRERDERIRAYYGEHFDEGERLSSRSAAGRLEFLRVQSLVRARLQPASTVLDVGGATGTHARWLVADGHAVTLVDPVPAQVDVAARIPGVRALVGDARSLEDVDASADAVIMLGPLYHLQDRADRLRALAEALRVLRPGGVVFAGAISRLSALTKTVLARGFRDLPADEVRVLLENGTTAGSLAPAAGRFPGGHHHTAAELSHELSEAGFVDVEVVGLEGPGGMGLELMAPDEEVVAAGDVLAKRLEASPYGPDLSPHLLGIASRPHEV